MEPKSKSQPSVLSRRLRTRLARLLQLGRQDRESGQAMVAVVVMTALLLILGTIAFWAAQANTSTASGVNADSQADASANAGIAAAVYSIESSSFLCSLTSSGSSALLSSSSGGPPNAGVASYAVTVNYYSTYPPGGTPMACSSGKASSTPGAAIVTSQGTGKLGPVTSKVTIAETLDLTLEPNDYVVFVGGQGVNFADLQVEQSAAASGTTAATGQVYADGDVTFTPSGPPPPCTIQASIIAQGSLNLGDGCVVSGSVSLGHDSSGNGYALLNHASVDGSVFTSSGNITMSDATVGQNVTAGGNVVLCPNPLGPTPPSACSGLTAGASTVDGAVVATGTVTLGNQLESTSPSAPNCTTATTSNGATVDGCITTGWSQIVSAPSKVSMPTFTAPTSSSVWSGGGYTTFYNNASCSGTSAGSVAYDANNETSATVIVANCALTISSTLNMKFNTAIIATGGITIGGGSGFKMPPPPSGSTTLPQLSLIVPTPTSSYDCGSGNYNITDSNGPALPNTISTFIFTPCEFSASAPVKMAGELMAETLGLSAPLSVQFQTFSPPGLSFGFQVVPEQRVITQG